MSQINVNHVYDVDGGGNVVVHGALDTPLGVRNKIINGKMDIGQRGLTFAAIANGAYCLDRWMHGDTTAGVMTASRQEDAPAGSGFQWSLRFAVTTADASLAAGDVCWFQQSVEGMNVRDLVGKPFTLSFWARSSKSGIHCVGFTNSGGDRSYVAEYTINVPNTWEYKTITVPSGLPTDGTWNWSTGIGLRVQWALASGTTWQTTKDTWQTGSFYSTSNQVNVLDTVGNIFAITGVQLEAGELATPFEHRPIGQEYTLCQRYYMEGAADLLVYTSAGSGFRYRITFPTPMRATPTMTGNFSSYTNASAGSVFSATAADFLWGATASALGACGVAGSWTANAEL